MSLPTGLAFVAASPKALACMPTAQLKRVYYDFKDMMQSHTVGGVPYTPVLPLLYGLRESMNMAMAEGIENVWARHHRLAEGTRAAVAGWGLKLLCKDPRWNSDSLTVIETPAGVDSNNIVKHAYARCVAPSSLCARAACCPLPPLFLPSPGAG